MEQIDLEPRTAEPAVRALIALSVGYPKPEKVDRVIGEYLRRLDMRLIGFEIDDELVGYVGFEVSGLAEAHLFDLAVLPVRQRGGIGRAIVRWLRESEGFTALRAGTDADAGGFYRRCGFVTERFVDERWPDAVR
ncbi:MAG: GNAT family N-acetyltransferase [Dehalococcoidia bacterium]|nr:GNAT family N-acetyltransferase [Dehalococcoidia bacterium]